MPCPVSLTMMRTHPSAAVVVTSTRPPARRELHGVVQQIPEDLLDAAAIGVDARHRGLPRHAQAHALGVGGRLERLQRGLDGGADVERR